LKKPEFLVPLNKKLKPVWLIGLIIVCFQFSFAGEIDSLKRLLLETHEVSKKIELFTYLSKAYQATDLIKAREMSDKALNLSISTGSSDYLGEIYGSIGDICVMQDSLQAARNYYEKAHQYFKLSENPEDLTGITMVLGNISYVQDNLSDAMRYYMMAVDHAKTGGLDHWLPYLNMNIGSINLKAGYVNEALDYFLISLDALKKANDTLSIGKVLANIGLVYLSLNELELSEDYFNQAVGIYQKVNAGVDLAAIYTDMAKLDQRKGNFNEAIRKLELGLELIERGDYDYAGPKSEKLSALYNGLGENYLLKKEDQKAKVYFEKAYDIGRANGQIARITDALKGLSDYWDYQGNSDSALHYYRIYKSFSDSVSNEDNIRKLAYQEAQFKYEQQLSAEKQKRENAVEQQKRNTQLLFFIILLLVLLLVVALLLLKLGRNKVKRIELQQQTLKNELELRNKELATHVIYQVKNNEFILNVSRKLQNALSSIIPENRPLINEVIKEIEFDSSQDAWKEFEVRFQRVHSGFSKKLATKFPDLTANELRLCSFLRLNMNTKDIAAITYQSVNSIDVARSRLRQKLGLDKDENLVTFLTQF
jgi:tetratricopeptide (TPR) repeat protein